uniref:HMA domain-containing protein n=1 Tax=Chenopodium quinoa TaxID=63459 RepID=A0A803MGV6_CHEQI
GAEEGEKKDDNGGGCGGCGVHLNILMKIDLHCEGCTKRIRKFLLNFPGVLSVEFEGENKVKVMAQNKVDPVVLTDKLRQKFLKKTELISPQPSKNNDKNNEKKDEKPKEMPVITVTLKVAYHCDGCGDKLYKTIRSYNGVHEVSIEKEKDLVKVTGRIEGKKMAEELQKKLKKTKELKYLVDGSGYVGLVDGSGRVIELFEAPRFFSDENPNACVIM